jgi:type I restriction enzyme S subunit
LIENYQKQIKLLEEAAQRLYKEWFVDLHFPGHENTKIVDGVPEGWEKKSVTDVLEIKYGKDHKLLKDGTNPVYGTGGVMRYVEKSLCTGESVLIPRKGSLNNILLVDGTFWTIDTMFYSIPKEDNVAKIVYFYLKGVDMYSFNIGAAVPSMTINILSGMKLLIPKDDIRKEFEKIVSIYFIRVQSLQSQIRLLTEARDRLLPKLMSGEIEI